MLDINYIRDNIDLVQYAIKEKKKDISIDTLLDLDDKRKQLQAVIDKLKFDQKKAGQDRNITLATSLKNEIFSYQNEYNDVMNTYDALLRQIPNVIHDSVPHGKDEDENVVVKRVGNPPVFDFIPLDHQTLGENLGLLDKEKAVQVTGSRFFYLKGDLALLQYAIVQYTFSILTSEEKLKEIISLNSLDVSTKPFQVVIPPLMIKYDTAEKMGRLYPMDDRYCLEEDKFMLIGSAEHSLGPIHMDDTLLETELPLRYVAYTPCFRREAGTYGKDANGILRTHQFDKIEMETFVVSEKGMVEQDFIIAIQEYLVHGLGLPYEKMMICTGDMGNMDYRQVDINTWIPAQNKYRETHTSDYMTDYQARRLNTKISRNDGSKEFAHMNDATAFALGRIIIAIMENYQNADGSIRIPEVLQKYMGKDVIQKNK